MKIKGQYLRKTSGPITLSLALPLEMIFEANMALGSSLTSLGLNFPI